MMSVLAQMMDRGDMGGGGSGHWWWWAVGLAVLVVLVAVVVAVTRNSPAHAAAVAQPARRSAEDVLADRFARGEIDEAEYRQRRETLRE